LLQWCQAICHSHGVPVRNFTTSFADGRALCLLVHYYHPTLLPLSAIQATTANLPRKVGMGFSNEEMEDWSVSLDLDKVTEQQCAAALRGERDNVSFVNSAMKELGGVPTMLANFDSTKRPEEKSILTAIAYICSRLIDSSEEIRSSMRIQRLYRVFLVRTGRGAMVK
ncbi:unnamed protein product, partial [Chrysoparadoxa australica]